MEIIDFAGDGATEIDRFDSREASVNHLTRFDGRGAVVVIRLGPSGIVGRHPAGADQLFIVVEGDGTVSGEDGVFVGIRAGQAASWRTGESHESRTEHGMTAVVVESESMA